MSDEFFDLIGSEKPRVRTCKYPVPAKGAAGLPPICQMTITDDPTGLKVDFKCPLCENWIVMCDCGQLEDASGVCVRGHEPKICCRVWDQ